ncbi:MAG: WD40 repeat domain-containing serine/threonine-protein kinase, partial [Planctomycetota bacterium]
TSDQLLHPAEAPTVEVSSANMETTQRPSRETHAGPYELVEIIGEGGFGTVYRGFQRVPIEREAAIKLIKPGMDSKEVLARFDGERRTLAKLQHPSIAQVFDAGTTNSGLPYFAMELVPGVPIDQFCENNQLTVDARIRLFEQACEAVHHAHRRGILHRDIKPSNVLAMFGEGAGPRAMVIDFGISKALESEPWDKTREAEPLTQQGQVLGTLEYMSPEQASLDSRELDIRTDIYSLGALFYRILTGEPPIQRERLLASGYWKIYQTLMEASIKRPSEITSLPSRDLDWIVMKTLEKDRELRYATVHDLLRDLQRFRGGHAIDARPPSLVYQLRLVVKRHWMPILVATVVLFALMAGTLGSLWGWRTASYARDEAEIARGQAEDSLGRLERAMYSSHLSEAWAAAQDNNSVTARRLLDEAPEQFRGFEWELLDRQVGRDQVEILVPPGGPAARNLDLNRSSERIACVRDDGKVVVIERDGETWLWKDERRATAARWLDRETLLVGLSGGVVKKVRLNAGEIAQSNWGPRGGVYDVVIGRDGSFAVCFGDGGVFIANASDFSIEQEWRAETRLSRLHWIADGTLVGCGFDGQIYRFEIGKKDHVSFPVGDRGPVQFVPNAEGGGTALAGSTLRVIESIEDVRSQSRFQLVSDASWSHARMIDDERFLLGSRDGKLAFVDLGIAIGLPPGSEPSDSALGYAKPTQVNGFDSAVCDLEYDASSLEAIVALIDGTVAVLPVDSLRKDRVTVQTDQNFTAGEAHDGSLFTLDASGTLAVWNLTDGSQTRSVAAHSRGGWEVAVSSNVILSVGEDQTIACWRASDLTELWRRPIGWGCRAIAISPDERIVAAAPPAEMSEPEGTIALYDCDDGEFIGLLRGHDNWVLKMIFDGDRLISSCENRTIRLWSLEQRLEEHRFVSPKQSVAEHLALSSDGQRIFSGHRDGSILAWGLESRNLERTLSAFGDEISGLASIGDRLVVTCSSDSRIKLFRQKDLAPVTSLGSGNRGWRRLIVSPKSQRLVLYDGQIGRSLAW